MFLLLVLAICFLANFVFYFEDEHLLIFLVVFLFCLGLSLINKLVLSVVGFTQNETFGLLVKQKTISISINHELYKTCEKIAFLVDEFAGVAYSMVEQISSSIVSDGEKQALLSVQMNTDKDLLFLSEEIARINSEDAAEFISAFLIILDAEGQDE